MKKLTMLGTALALVVTLSATGCKKKGGDQAKPDNQKPVDQPADPKGSAAPTPDPAAGSAAGSAAPADPAAGSAAPAAGSAAPADPAAGSAAPAAGSAATASTGVADCDAYLAVVEKAATCDQLGAERDVVKKSAEAWKASVAGWSALDDAARKAAKDAAVATCKAAAEGVKASVTKAGCTL